MASRCAVDKVFGKHKSPPPQADSAVGAGTLLHSITQVVTAVWLPRSAPTGRAATMTLRGAASSLGAAGGAATLADLLRIEMKKRQRGVRRAERSRVALV